MPKFTPGTPKPPNSGRRAGTLNKRTERIREQMQKLGCNPFRILADIALGKEIGGRIPDLSDQRDAAKELCAYIAPKLRAVELTGDVPAAPSGVLLVPAPVSMDEWQKIVDREKEKREPKTGDASHTCDE